MTSLHRLLPCLLLLAAVACGGGDAGPEPTPTDGPSATPTATAAPTEPGGGEPVVRFVGPDGEELAFVVEVVADPPSRQRGLMERTELPADAGMLFLFPEDTGGGFWMKNTLIPLDIAYIAADGGVVDVLQMEPCEADPCDVYTPAGPYRSAVEVNAGALLDEGVDDTWSAELPPDLPDPQ